MDQEIQLIIVFWMLNDNFEQLTGLKRENIIGKTVLEILPGTESYWIEKYGHVAMTGELFSMKIIQKKWVNIMK
ncbi:hypothetical protein KHA80_22910 [Anaerobacillus sp. HL2]|nr:hypothetical protein KHA80_22910 [Anaerobacillus sp. HL2]